MTTSGSVTSRCRRARSCSSVVYAPKNRPPGIRLATRSLRPAATSVGLQLQTDIAVSPTGDVWAMNNWRTLTSSASGLARWRQRSGTTARSPAMSGGSTIDTDRSRLDGRCEFVQRPFVSERWKSLTGHKPTLHTSAQFHRSGQSKPGSARRSIPGTGLRVRSAHCLVVPPQDEPLVVRTRTTAIKGNPQRTLPSDFTH